MRHGHDGPGALHDGRAPPAQAIEGILRDHNDRVMSPADHVRSWYAATANRDLRFPALEGDLRCDVLVVGGGYTGLSTAIELRGHGLDVVLVEGKRVGWGASGRNGGQAVTGFNRDPSVLSGWVGRDDARKLWDMSEEAKAILRQRVERHGIDCDLRWGYLLGAEKRRHMAELQEQMAEWEGISYHQGRLLSRDEIRTLVDSPRYVGGLLDSGSGQLHPLNYALGLAEAARSLGVRIFEDTEVTRLHHGDPAVATTPWGRITARFVALCGNAYLPALSAEVDRTIRSRVMPVGTYIIATEPLGPDLAQQVIPSGFAVADINFVLNYYRLGHDTRMLFGGGVSYSGYEPPRLAAQMRRTMVRTLPRLADLKVEYCWGGYVAITMNRTPHFGRVAPNVYFAQGFSGHGVLLTGMAGRVMAEAIRGQAGRFDVFARIPHQPFPGGRMLRMPALVLAMAWYRLRDMM